MSLTHIVSNLTEIDNHLTEIDNHLTLLDDNEKPLAIAFVSTFTIFPVLAHNPIVKELTKPTLFCLSASWESLPKKINQFQHFVDNKPPNWDRQ
ncbi:MAG: hypothetical protein JEY96_19770 [Bacteroidales bacterium]|nr:hypothetical protein [Bacteroidales bacterium]